MNSVNIIFPHQLFQQSDLLDNNFPIYLVEEYLFFKHYNFHKQKLAFHRASMKFYQSYLESKGKKVIYVQANETTSDIRLLIPELIDKGVREIHIINPVDDWLEKRLSEGAKDMLCTIYESPYFINLSDEYSDFFKATKKKYFQTSFYIEQRKKLRILIDKNASPTGGKWSYDTDNRKKYPKDKEAPKFRPLPSNEFYSEAVTYVNQNFSDNLGQLSDNPIYPNDFAQTSKWLNDFFDQRFYDFGIYEDAIVDKEHFLNHSILTPMLNVGLITPAQIIDAVLAYSQTNEIPLNSLEGFIRQIIGWREFIRGIYVAKGTEERNRNFFQHSRKIPPSFYDGTTGIVPIDTTIKKILKTAYAHHIERLMVLGNFMLLCEFDPDEIYRWFMELFIDAYDWVMVPNVYGMSQFADGGLMSTKPYISSSNYLRKMSNYKKDEWQDTWDALYWQFIDKHRDVFNKNIRMKFMVSMYDKMSSQKKEKFVQIVDNYFTTLDVEFKKTEKIKNG
ncbi:MAG: cryptochrome/photolyase family protein [Flavobacteriales bacterium]|jgi:deoxyribodipyrimidine photolyase-related protein|nr:cryptochrome/photolyase family protein [Flavobacteriales bacterium]